MPRRLQTQQNSHRPQASPPVPPPGSYFKGPKSRLVRPLACNWYYCAPLIARPKAAHALHSVRRDVEQIGLRAHMMSSIKPEINNLALRRQWGLLGSRVISVLGSGAEGPGFKSQPRRRPVTVLGKLFTPNVPLFTKQQNWQQAS